MKTFLLKVVFAGLALFILAATSCKETEDPQPTPPVIKETTLSAVANPSTVEFGQSTTITVSSNGTVTLPNGASVGTTLSLPKIVRDTTITFFATGEGGQKTLIVPLKVKYPVEKVIGKWKFLELWVFDRKTPFSTEFTWNKIELANHTSRTIEYFADGRCTYIDTSTSTILTDTWNFETHQDGRPVLRTSADRNPIEFLSNSIIKLSTEYTPAPTPDGPNIFRNTYSIRERVQ